MNASFLRSVGCALALLAFAALPSRADEANQLTTAEKAEGWKLLFNGQTTDGWRGFKKTSFPTNGWLVEDGWLKCVAGGRGGDIITVERFDNYEFQWEWRIPPRANNGVKYFVTEQRSEGIGHEYQMLDDRRGGRPKQQTASFYDVLGPRPHQPVRVAPEVNHSRIVVRGNQVEHWLNGEKVLEYECGSDALKTAIAESKFKSVPGFGEKITGHILLTYHRDEACFRNLKIRPLPAPGQQTGN
jgi:hypothetical protein